LPAALGPLEYSFSAVPISVDHDEQGDVWQLSRANATNAETPAVKILLSEEQIRQGVSHMAQNVARIYVGKPLSIIGVLTGSIMIVADLVRRLDMPVRIGFLRASSYRGTATEPGELLVNDDLLPDIRGRDVLIVDDIFDTGHTLHAIRARLHELGAASVRSLVLLRKHGRKEVEIEPDHVVFDIPNAFVVGYGLDYEDAYRHLPYVAVLEEDDLAQGPPQ
jgi:hypoxanthine phosphoribosyltransferase